MVQDKNSFVQDMVEPKNQIFNLLVRQNVYHAVHIS